MQLYDPEKHVYYMTQYITSVAEYDPEYDPNINRPIDCLETTFMHCISITTDLQ